MSSSHDRTASMMTPAKLAQVVSQRATASPAGYLDQMAADVGHQHVKRLAELCVELKQQAAASKAATLAPALQQLADALPRLDFNLLQQTGFWAGMTGKSRNAGAEFAAQFEELAALAKALASAVPGVQKEQQVFFGASDRTLVEFEVEYRALDGVIEQGARWLQDMRNQLKSREASASGDAEALQKIRDDTARCEVLVGRLKLLRTAAAASQQAHQQARATAQRRAGFMQSVQKLLASEVREWRSSLGTLAGSASEGKLSGLRIDGPQDVHRDLRQRLAQVLADGQQLRTDEDGLVKLMDGMAAQLTAAS